jgi:glyoxylase I family protein
VRVTSYREMVAFLESRGYRAGVGMIVDPQATAGFPQIYMLDPDRHVIEINAAALA